MSLLVIVVNGNVFCLLCFRQRMYCVIVFDVDNTLAVVPYNWLVDDEAAVMWKRGIPEKHLSTARPFDKTYTKWKCAVKYKTGTYSFMCVIEV